MKTHLIILLFFFVAACAPKKEQTQKPKEYTMTQFMDIVQITGGAFSPDESKVLFSSKETGIFNAYEIDVKTGEKKQLTNSTDNAIQALDYFPNGDQILYSADSGGNEITHLYARSGDGKSTDLIQDKKAKAQFGGWSYNKKFLYYSSNSRDKKYFDLYRTQVGDKPEGKVLTSMAYKNTDGMDAAAISDDDRYIALTKSISTSNGDMYLLDTQSGKTKLLSQHNGDFTYTPQYFSHDGKKLFYLTNEGSEFT
jgi:Tol biopolymer transport system component